MKKIVIAIVLVSFPSLSSAGWISTYMAYQASVDAKDAKKAALSISDHVDFLQKEMDELKKIILKMAEDLDRISVKKINTKNNHK